MQTICDDKDRIYDYMLAMVPGVGDVTISALMDAFGSAKEVFKANEKTIEKRPMTFNVIGHFYL